MLLKLHNAHAAPVMFKAILNTYMLADIVFHKTCCKPEGINQSRELMQHTNEFNKYRVTERTCFNMSKGNKTGIILQISVLSERGASEQIILKKSDYKVLTN